MPKKALGDVDYTDHVHMLLLQDPIGKSKTMTVHRVWVKIRKASKDKLRGTGVIDTQLPDGFTSKQIALRLGDVIEFVPGKKHFLRWAVFKRKLRVRNQLSVLLKSVGAELQAALIGNQCRR